MIFCHVPSIYFLQVDGAFLRIMIKKLSRKIHARVLFLVDKQHKIVYNIIVLNLKKQDSSTVISE